ncbi:MAG: hypothetical protein ABI742_09470 [Gemmatimonadota bacterium]
MAPDAVALQALLDALVADGESSAEALRTRAQAEAAEIRATLSARIAQNRASAMTDREVAIRRDIEATLAETRQSLNRLLLGDRDALLEAVRAETRKLIPEAARATAYQAVLARDLAEGMSYLEGLEVQACAAPDQKESVSRMLEQHSRVTLKVDPAITAGVRLIGDTGAVIVDATLEGRLEAGWPEFRIAVARTIEATA